MGDERELCGGDLIFEVADGVASITLNRPASANAITPDQRDTMVALFQRCDLDRTVRAIVLSANGRHFCAGADLRQERPDLEPDVEIPTTRFVGTVTKSIAYGVHRLVCAMLDCQKPVVASVQGMAAGVGCQLVLASDLVVMAEETAILENFVDRGLVPDGGACYLLVRQVGLQRAKEILMLGDRIGAEKAQRYGIVTDVVPLADLAQRTAELAARLASGPTTSLGFIKRLTNRALDVDRATALYEETMAQELVTNTVDTQDALAAFVERRPTVFRGY